MTIAREYINHLLSVCIRETNYENTFANIGEKRVESFSRIESEWRGKFINDETKDRLNSSALQTFTSGNEQWKQLTVDIFFLLKVNWY
jgi:hypothetical protein